LTYELVEEEEVAEALGLSRHDAQAESAAAVARPQSTPPDTGHTGNISASSSAPIFVVHGHDHGLLYEAVRVLERATSREVIVLHEQANAGRTILEKFEAHAATASYAVVLLTADDVGGAVGKSTAPRGR
jgi:predicted nucleotide-binding protein